MTDRLIIGRHPLDGSYGIWLSKPGVSATNTVDPNNFLIAPGVKNDMLLMAGIIGNGGVAYFPETLSNTPFVYFHPINDGASESYPFPINIATTAGNSTCNVTTSYAAFYDHSGLGLSFRYIVVNRALP